MAILGSFAGELFEVSDEKVITPYGISREEGTRWVAHDVMMRKPAAEFLGPSLGKASFKINLNTWFCENIKREMDKWLSMARAGTVGVLIIGEPIGVDSWKLLSVTQGWTTVSAFGKLLSATLSLSFEEYISGVW